MRLILILIISFGALSVNAQIETQDPKEANASVNTIIGKLSVDIDSVPSVQYVKTMKDDKPAVFYLNGEIMNSSILNTLNSKLIDSVNVVQNEIEVNGTNYFAQIFIKMKDGYNPKIISLTDLKSKYLHPTNKPVLFMIDNGIVKGNSDTYLVDENYILKIVVDGVENEGLNIEIVRLLTRTEKNLHSNKNIMIRGLDDITMN